MYARILVCLDGDMDIDEHILDHVAGLSKVLGSELLLLRVAHYHTRDARAAETSEAEDCTDQARVYLRERGVTNVRIAKAAGEPSEAIIRTAENEAVDLIAMSTHGHGFIRDVLFGSVSDQVRHNTAIPVLLLRHPARAVHGER